MARILMTDLDKRQRIRSYVLRTGRMTQVQKELAALGP
jgi:hypothetical protein